MSDEIKVTVSSWGDGRPLALRWTDPISGKRKAKSSGTTDPKKAERLAHDLQKQLAEGADVQPNRITWADFRARFEAEKLAGMCEGTRHAYGMALDHLEKRLHPDRLVKLTTPVLSRFAADLLRTMRPTTANKHLRHVKATVRWAERQGYLSKAPRIELHKAPAKMKGRPITAEEYERMTGKVAVVRPNDAEQWSRFLTALWLSGLRLGEAVALSWDDGAFQLDLSGKHPAFRIEPEGQKAARAELAPATPDFITWILDATPEALRTGKVLPLVDERGVPFTPEQAGRIVKLIGKAAGVVVDRGKRFNRKKEKWVEAVKFATAHDLRRSFGNRWARRVMPALLQRLMRHSSVTTSLTFYAGLSADEVASELWRNHPPAEASGESNGNKHGNIDPVSALAGQPGNDRKPLQRNK